MAIKSIKSKKHAPANISLFLYQEIPRLYGTADKHVCFLLWPRGPHARAQSYHAAFTSEHHARST